MKNNKLLLRLALCLTRILTSSRYKITVKGLDVISSQGAKLYLPNHQAIVDPIILLPQIHRVSSAVPVVTESYFNLPIVKNIFQYWGAISVSDLESGSRDTAVLDELTIKTLECFKRGESVVIYPSGQLMGQGYEKIFNKQGAWKIVASMPKDVKIIGVRISGLWGSQWSKAWTGESPNFGLMMIRSVAYVLSNLIVFVPKRVVSIEFVDITHECTNKAKLGKNAFNVALESFYNSAGEESVLFLKHFFFLKKTHRVLPTNISGSVSDMTSFVSAKTMDDIPLHTFQTISKITANVLKCNINSITLSSNLMLELSCDSLNLVEIITEIEQVFPKVNIPEITAIRTISDLCLSTMGLLEEKIILKEQFFTQPIKFKSKISINPSKDIVSQFLEKVKESPSEWFTYDEMLGSTRRRDFLLKALVVSEIIKKKTKSEYIGILLPATQSSAMLILSTYLAGKKPVMLNWTVGNKVLEHCIDSIKLDTILSAGKFIAKIEEQLPISIKDKLILLENEIKNISTFTKLSALFHSRFPRVKIKPIDINSIAVILFTSGSEDLPKAVPLTHKNIVSNLSSVFQTIEIENDLIFAGFLPPFHSFGFTVLTILPLISGVRIGYSPDPTDGKSITRLIKHIGANVIIGSPSFLKIVLSHGSINDFRTIKYAISGAEATSPSLLELFAKMTTNATLLEGYGITECAPVLSINPLEKQIRLSVGKFIKGVNGLIIGLETNKVLAPFEEGMIYVSGDNIFKGYINNTTNPFELIDGQSYYKTGDLGYVNNEGYIFITGRLKRFIKIGGEMISLPFIEKIMAEKYSSTEVQSIAIEGSDKIIPPTIVLFTTTEINIEEANQYLQMNGVSPLAKIRQTIVVNDIPLLGSGKINYKQLKTLIEH